MPIRDQAAQERSLDNDYGTTRGPNAPASFQVALFDGDPALGGVELGSTTDTDAGLAPNGYARATLSNDDWHPAAGGIKATSSPVVFPDALEEWAATATHWGLYDPAAGVWWDCARLLNPLDVTAAGPGPTVALAVFYDNNLD